jgi:hypothetical protein
MELAKTTLIAPPSARRKAYLAIVDGSGKLYLLLGVNHENPGSQLMPFIEEKVKVAGTSVERGGMSGIAIKSVQFSLGLRACKPNSAISREQCFLRSTLPQ